MMPLPALMVALNRTRQVPAVAAMTSRCCWRWRHASPWQRPAGHEACRKSRDCHYIAVPHRRPRRASAGPEISLADTKF